MRACPSLGPLSGLMFRSPLNELEHPSMALEQSIDLAFASRIGEGGLEQAAFETALGEVGEAMKRLSEDDASGRLPLLHMPRASDDLAAVREAAARLRQDATDVVFLGTGGSSLGGQALAQLRDYAVPGAGRFTESPRVHFLDNLDPTTFDLVLQRLPLATSRFVAVSKSGGTGETLMQAIAVLSALDRAGLRPRAGELMLGLSEPRKKGGRNGLRDLLEPEGVPFLEHHTGVGGRYSVLTNVGLLPAAVLGLDIEAIRAGAADAYAPLRAGRPVLDQALPPRAGEPGFAGKRIGALVAAQGRATADTLAKNNRPTRRLHVERLDERALGELLMHFMLETILTGYALGVDPFDQPAVEEGKILAKKYLAEGRG